MAARNGSDLGALQTAAEEAAKALRAALVAKNKAIDAANRAEELHVNAQKALTAGLAQIQASTKVL